jgi:hypothetical protein
MPNKPQVGDSTTPDLGVDLLSIAFDLGSIGWLPVALTSKGNASARSRRCQHPRLRRQTTKHGSGEVACRLVAENPGLGRFPLVCQCLGERTA